MMSINIIWYNHSYGSKKCCIQMMLETKVFVKEKLLFIRIIGVLIKKPLKMLTMETKPWLHRDRFLAFVLYQRLTLQTAKANKNPPAPLKKIKKCTFSWLDEIVVGQSLAYRPLVVVQPATMHGEVAPLFSLWMRDKRNRGCFGQTLFECRTGLPFPQLVKTSAAH